MGQVDTAMATSGPSYDNNEWDYGGIKVTKLLSKKAGFELRHIWLQGLHSVSSITGAFSGYIFYSVDGLCPLQITI